MARLIGRWRIWQLKARDLRDSSEQPTYHCLSSLSIWTYPPLAVCHHCLSSDDQSSLYFWVCAIIFYLKCPPLSVCHYPDQYHWCCHPVYICCSNLQFIILFRQPLSALELPHHILPSFRKKHWGHSTHLWERLMIRQALIKRSWWPRERATQSDPAPAETQHWEVVSVPVVCISLSPLGRQLTQSNPKWIKVTHIDSNLLIVIQSDSKWNSDIETSLNVYEHAS